MMEDDTSKAKSAETIAPVPAVVPSKTFRLKLATSLQAQAERTAYHQGVSVTYLITKAIEEKITRFRQNQQARRDRHRVHLVSDV